MAKATRKNGQIIQVECVDPFNGTTSMCDRVIGEDLPVCDDPETVKAEAVKMLNSGNVSSFKYEPTTQDWFLEIYVGSRHLSVRCKAVTGASLKQSTVWASVNNKPVYTTEIYIGSIKVWNYGYTYTHDNDNMGNETWRELEKLFLDNIDRSQFKPKANHKGRGRLYIRKIK